MISETVPAKISSGNDYQFLEMLPVGVFILNRDGQPHYANEQAKQIQGKGIMPNNQKLTEVYKAKIEGTDEDYPMSEMPIVKALQGEYATVSNMEIVKRGKRIPLEVTASPLYDKYGKVEYAVAVFHDISERKQFLRQIQGQKEGLEASEEKLRQNLEEMQAIQDRVAEQEAEKSSILDAINLSSNLVEFTLDGEIIHINDKACAFFGTERDRIVGRNVRDFDLSWNSDNKAEREAYRQLWIDLKAGKAVIKETKVALPKKTLWLRETISPVKNKEGEIVKAISISVDITEQVEALQAVHSKSDELVANEEELRQNLEEMKALQEKNDLKQEMIASFINSSTENIYMFDKEYKMALFNEHAANDYAKQGVQLQTGMSMLDLVLPDHRERAQESFERVLGGEAFEKEQKYEFKGYTGYLHLSYFPIGAKDENGKSAYAGMQVKDITERKLQELELVNTNQQLSATEEELRQNMEELEAQREQIASKNAEIVGINQKLEKHREALVQLTKDEAIQNGELHTALETITRTTALQLKSSRVSLWNFDGQQGKIDCLKLYGAKDDNFESGALLYEKDFPNYFQALRAEEIIPASNAHTHPATAEFSEAYLKPLDIHAMLDIPYFIDGKLAGVICCEQQAHTRKWTMEEIAFVKSVTDIITIAIQSANKKEQQEAIGKQQALLDQQHDKMLNSIKYAKTIQEAILPTEKVRQSIFDESFVLYNPKDIVSGDFYWFSEKEGMQLAAAIDCTGHGVPGAFMSLIGHNILGDIINRQGITEPAEILNQLDYQIRIRLKQDEGANNDGMDLGICRFEQTEGDKVKITYSGAKHKLYIVHGGELREYRSDRKTIGGKASCNQATFTDQIIEVGKGDMVYLATDGYTDQANEKRKCFSSNRLKELIHSIHVLPADEQQIRFEQALDLHQGRADQRDDITLIGIRI